MKSSNSFRGVALLLFNWRGFYKTRDCDMRSAGEGHGFDLDETHSGNYR